MDNIMLGVECLESAWRRGERHQIKSCVCVESKRRGGALAPAAKHNDEQVTSRAPAARQAQTKNLLKLPNPGRSWNASIRYFRWPIGAVPTTLIYTTIFIFVASQSRPGCWLQQAVCSSEQHLQNWHSSLELLHSLLELELRPTMQSMMWATPATSNGEGH